MGKLSVMSAAKEKIFPGKIAAWLAVLFIILAATGTPVAVAKTPCTLPNRAGENSVAAVQLRLAQSSQTPYLQRENSIGRYDLALDDTLAAENPLTGTALARQLGQEGENAVGITGPKVGIEMPSGATRFPDAFDKDTNVLDEVKNVSSLSYTQQLRDYAAYTQQRGGTFNLWVRPSTRLSGPLLQAKNAGQIIVKYIPGAK